MLSEYFGKRKELMDMYLGNKNMSLPVSPKKEISFDEDDEMG